MNQELGWQVYHFGAPKESYLVEWLHFLVKHPHHNLILDRFHLGDLVYGPKWRGKTMTRQEFSVIELALKIRGCTLVHVYLNPARAAEVLRVRGDDLVKPEEVADHIEGFMKVVRQSLIPLTHWSHERPEPLRLGQIKARHAHSLEYRLVFPSMPGIGEIDAEVIVVGEKPNRNRQKDAMGVPFAVGPAGEWLFEALDELNLLRGVYLTNAEKDDGNREMVAHEIRWLQSQTDREIPVVALGGLASTLLQVHKIPHRLAQHPSYARRFHYSKSYAEHLGEVMA